MDCNLLPIFLHPPLLWCFSIPILLQCRPWIFELTHVCPKTECATNHYFVWGNALHSNDDERFHSWVDYHNFDVFHLQWLSSLNGTWISIDIWWSAFTCFPPLNAPRKYLGFIGSKIAVSMTASKSMLHKFGWHPVSNKHLTFNLVPVPLYNQILQVRIAVWVLSSRLWSSSFWCLQWFLNSLSALSC